MDLGRGLGHLSYSTLVHPADNWVELWDSITRYLPAVKKRLSPAKPFAVSLSTGEQVGRRADREP